MSDQQILEKVPQQKTKLPEATRKVLFENDQVIVIETYYPEGGMVPMHIHRYPHVLYVVEGGNLEVTSLDGKSVLTDALQEKFSGRKHKGIR